MRWGTSGMLLAVVTAACLASAAQGKTTAGALDDWAVVEASGLVASRVNRGVFWTHNDSGDYARVFAVRAADGTVAGEFHVTNAAASDWEDLALNGRGELCAGDFGGHRNFVTVYCFPEPRVDASPLKPKVYGSVSATHFHLNYPDRIAHDAETLIIEPSTNTFAIVSKGGETGSILYTARDPAAWVTTTLEAVATLPLYGGWAGAVAGDVSWSGEKVVIKSYGSTFFLFDGRSFFRSGGDPYNVYTDWDGAEAVAFAPGSESTVYTLSEGSAASLIRYDL